MCNTSEESGFIIVRVYTFFNLIPFIFSIVHYGVAFNLVNHVKDMQEFINNFEGDVAMRIVTTANRFMIIFMFNLMNSIILWRQYAQGGIKERVIFEAACIVVSYLWLVVDSIVLLVVPGSFVGSVVPLFVLTLLMLFVTCYFAVVIIYSSDAVENKLLKGLSTEAAKKAQTPNIEINFQQPQGANIEANKIEENKNEAVELKATKGGYNMVVENSKFDKANEIH